MAEKKIDILKNVIKNVHPKNANTQIKNDNINQSEKDREGNDMININIIHSKLNKKKSEIFDKKLSVFEILNIKEEDRNDYNKILVEFNKAYKFYKQQKTGIYMDSTICKNRIRKSIHQKTDEFFLKTDIISALQIPTEKRTFDNIYLIRKYIKSTNFIKLFQNEIEEKGPLYYKLLLFLSFELKVKKFNENEEIFKIGEQFINFYLLIDGKIDILKPMPKIYNISGYEYFVKLMEYRQTGNDYLLSLCVQENKKNFEIKESDVNFISYIYLMNKLEAMRYGDFVDFGQALKLVGIPPQELGLEPDKIQSNLYILQNIDNIMMKMPIISKERANYYKFFDSKEEKQKVVLFYSEPYNFVDKNEFFGEGGFLGKGFRNDTSKTLSECYLGYIDYSLYNNVFSEEIQPIVSKKIDFLHKHFFFGKLSGKKLEHQYLNYFKSETYYNNDIIYKEDEINNYIYFIEEGSIELYSSKTISEIQILLKYLEKVREKMKEKNEMLHYSNVNSNWMELKNSVSKKDLNKIVILNKNTSFGLESFYYQIPNIGTAKVSSMKAKVIKIDYENLFQILMKSNECVSDLEKKVHLMIDILTKRYFNINNTKLIMIDKKLKYDDMYRYSNHMIEVQKLELEQ